jgi:hypothetical protein
MSRLYGERHRALQDEFDSRRMADRIELRTAHRLIQGRRPWIHPRGRSSDDLVSEQGANDGQRNAKIRGLQGSFPHRAAVFRGVLRVVNEMKQQGGHGRRQERSDVSLSAATKVSCHRAIEFLCKAASIRACRVRLSSSGIANA